VGSGLRNSREPVYRRKLKIYQCVEERKAEVVFSFSRNYAVQGCMQHRPPQHIAAGGGAGEEFVNAFLVKKSRSPFFREAYVLAESNLCMLSNAHAYVLAESNLSMLRVPT
jgi:hypothetical protein